MGPPILYSQRCGIYNDIMNNLKIPGVGGGRGSSMKELNHVLTLWTSSQITKFTVTERSLGVRIYSQQSVSPRRVLLQGMCLCSLHYNVVPHRKLIVLYFYGNYFRNPLKFSMKILLSHVVEARIIETLGKKREKNEMLN